MTRAAPPSDLAPAEGIDAPVVIVDHDPAWLDRFQSERESLLPLLGPAIHHIGSTAVPGLAAKPVVDLMAWVDDLDRPLPALISEHGYSYPEDFNRAPDRRRWLCKPSAAHRTHHLHLVQDRAVLDRYLRFRDALRARPELAAAYARLKRELAVRHRADREAYTDGKSSFVEEVLSAWP